MSRADIATALNATPAKIQDELTGPSAEALALLSRHLPEDEEVSLLMSAAPTWVQGSITSLLVLTDRRLIFVSPTPQVLSWSLGGIDRVQATNKEQRDLGIFFVNDVQFGHGHDDYAQRFADAGDYAIAIARLSGGIVPLARLLEDVGTR